MLMDAYIKGISYYLPKKVVTNKEISSEFPEWTVEKIYTKLGIRKRHVVDKGETALDLGVNAARRLFEEYSFPKEDLEFLIFCTQSADYHLPTSACIIQEQLGLPKSIGAIDVNLGCSGWIYGIYLAKSLVSSGMATNVLVITSETYSIYLHNRDKGNRTIFGDGAAATLVSTEGLCRLGESVLGTDGRGFEKLIVKTGGARCPEKMNDTKLDDFGNPLSSDYLYMNGPDILNYTLEIIPTLYTQVLEKNLLLPEDIDLNVFHQANQYIAKLQRRKLRIPQEKYFEYFECVGNTVSSTIPIALKEAINQNKIQEGSKVLSVAQGLGYSWAGVVMFF